MGKKKNKNKYNFERRRAIKCKFIEKSKTSPGYLKYEVTICEKDGTKHKQPAYGVDMQSAIARLVAIAWIAIMAWPVVITGTNAGASFVLLSFGGIFLVMLLGVLWYNYINKK